MIIKVKGLIEKETNYSESSKIVEIFTKEYGIISVLAKGCKRNNSSTNLVGLLTYGEFNIYYKEDKLSTLKSLDCINLFKNIRKDYDLINYVFFLVNASLQVFKQDNDFDIYDILIETIIKIDDLFDPIVLIDIVLTKYLYYLGVPLQEKCIMCNSTNDIVTISSDIGGFICKNCYTNEVLVKEKTVRYLRTFNYINIKSIKKIELDSNIKIEINSFILNYYDKYTGIYLNKKLLGEYCE